ncbi:TonB-dependent siderophore receptor [Vibrio sp. AK197]
MKISHPFVFSTLAAALLSALSTSSVAETTESEGETITVLGQTYRNTATKSALEPEETPQGVTILDGDLLQQRGVKSLDQALRYAPGVVSENKGSSVTMYDNFTVRGFSVNQSYYDGLVLQYLSGWNLQPQIDPIALQQVEVFKGPTSVLYGAMPPGGMINMIAKTPQQQAATEVNFATGSRNLTEASIDTTGQIADSDFAYRVIALARKQDSQVDGMEQERYVFAPSLDWQATDKTLLNFNLYYQKDPSMGINSAIPASGTVYSNPNGSTSPSTYAGDSNWSQFEREFWLAGFKVNHEFNDNWTWLTNARYLDANLTQHNTYHQCYVYAGTEYCDFDEATGTLNRSIYSTNEESKGFTVDNQIAGQILLSNIEHNLLFGADYQRLDGSSLYKEFTTPNGTFYNFNIFAPNNDLLDPSNLAEIYNEKIDIDVEQLGLYFQDQIRYEKWILLAGARWDHYTAKSDSNLTGETDTDQNEFSYRVGAMYQFDNGLSPYISYATGFEPTAGKDINGDDYKPEMSRQIETGVKYQSEDLSKTATLSLFRIIKDDAIINNPADFLDPDLQIGELTSQGIEFQGQWVVNTNLDITASYTYSDIEISQDDAYSLEGTTPIYVPHHSANLWTNYYLSSGPLRGARLGGGARYVGEMEMDATNTQGKVPSYTIVDLSVGYDLGEISDSMTGASANLIANNLFDEESYTCYDNANCWYGAERSVELNVKYQF